MTTGTLELGDGKLYYEVAGEGKTVVFAHAAFVDSGMWDDQWDAFAQHYRVIRYDLRGYGKSDPISAPRTHRHDLYRLLEHLGVERAALVGCSMSGQMILDMALERPELASALVVVNGIASGFDFEMEGEPPPLVLEMIDAMNQGDLARVSDVQIRLWVDGVFRQPEEINPSVRQRAAAMNRTMIDKGTQMIDDAPPLDPPAIGRLSEIHAPTLIVVGALDEPVILHAADVMIDGIPGARKFVIPNTAHVPNMEQPAQFNRAVLDFLSTMI